MHLSAGKQCSDGGGSHGQNQAAAAIEEAGGDKEDKAEPYRTLRTHIHILNFLTSLPSKIKN